MEQTPKPDRAIYIIYPDMFQNAATETLGRFLTTNELANLTKVFESSQGFKTLIRCAMRIAVEEADDERF